MKNGLACILIAALFQGCGGGSAVTVSNAEKSLDNVSAAAWDTLAGKRIFFGHQSVGYNILDGMRSLMSDHPSIRFSIVETKDPQLFESSVFAHAQVGRNEDPGSKCEAFERYLDSGIGSRADIAFFKFCYVDVDSATDVGTMFETYKATIRRIKTKYPGLILVHVTVPLTSSDHNLKARLKALVKRTLGRKDANVGRNELNDRIRKEFNGIDPVFDLAAIESTSPSGEPVTFNYQGKKYSKLYRGYTTDGGHLNEAGKRLAAAELLHLLVRIAR